VIEEVEDEGDPLDSLDVAARRVVGSAAVFENGQSVTRRASP
jgi:hypothetical protein